MIKFINLVSYQTLNLIDELDDEQIFSLWEKNHCFLLLLLLLGSSAFAWP